MKKSTWSLVLAIAGGLILAGGIVFKASLPLATAICVVAGVLALSALVLGIMARKEAAGKAAIAVSIAVSVVTSLVAFA